MTLPAKKPSLDILEFVKTSREFGVKEGLAEFQARQIAQADDDC